MTHRYMDHRVHVFLFGSELAFHLNRSRGSASESLHYRVSLRRVKLKLLFKLTCRVDYETFVIAVPMKGHLRLHARPHWYSTQSAYRR